MQRWGRVAGAYLLLAAVVYVGAVLWRGASPVVHPGPWLELPSRQSHVYSLLIGLSFGALLVMLTRFSVERFAWARNLHRDLRPVARGMSTGVIVLVALMSALGEELLFRGLLQPEIGLVAQAALFGLVHQLPGTSRWVWAGWAALVGLALGAIFSFSGSLLGPIAAHALVNGVNLTYLRAHDPSARRVLGGLLGTRSARHV